MKILFVDLTTALESFTDLETKGRGGMVSSLYILPNGLSKMGHECFVWSDAKTGGVTPDGVKWLVEQDVEWIYRQAWDIIVLNRQTYSMCLPEISAKRRILWVHDMVHGGWIQYPEQLSKIDATVFMGWYSMETWMSYYKGINQTYMIPNGVDKDLFKPLEKDLKTMVYISAPNRGLQYLPIVFQTVKEKIPDVKCVAYSNMGKLHPNEKRSEENFKSIYDAVKESGIELKDPVPQKEIAKVLGHAGLMVKPNDYAETCSNTTLQALACGTPVITSRVGADKEWIDDEVNGCLCKHTMVDGPLFILEMCRAVMATLKDEGIHQDMIKNAVKTPKVFTWKEIGEQWNEMLESVY